MPDIICRGCNELNDCNAYKCEHCKARLSDPDSSEIDECESDYRFIEEAELKGEVYKLEVFNENTSLDAFQGLQVPLEIKEEPDNIEENSLESLSESHESKEVDAQETVLFGNGNTETAETPTLRALPYQCDQCPKSFKRQATLKAHVNRIHDPNDDFSYDLGVGKKFKAKRSPSPNFSDSCGSEYEPPQGEEDMPKKQPKTHLKTKRKLKLEDSDSENNNSCKKVKTSPSKTLLGLMQNKPRLKRHMVYKCTACEKITTDYSEHIKHVAIHEAPVQVNSLTETTSLEKLKKTPSGFVKCDECDRVFMSDRDLSIHTRMDHEGGIFPCDMCAAVLISESTLRKHKVRAHKRRPGRRQIQFECIICNQKFATQFLMIQHRKTHADVMKKIEEMTIIDRTEGKPVLYVCKVCAKTSKNKYRHEEHLRVHTKEKPYKCEKCGERISTANALAHHMRLHENDRPFKCDICAATYRHKKSLKKHLRVHTGLKPFKCFHCEKTFAFNYTRADHVRKCHIGEGTTKTRKPRQYPGPDEELSPNEVPEEDKDSL